MICRSATLPGYNSDRRPIEQFMSKPSATSGNRVSAADAGNRQKAAMTWQVSGPGAAQGADESWSAIVDAIERVRSLPENWDDQGAAAIQGELVDSAIELVQALKRTGSRRCPDSISPGVNGTVLLEWFDGPAYTEIEVLRPFYAEETIVAPGQEPAMHVIRGQA